MSNLISPSMYSQIQRTPLSPRLSLVLLVCLLQCNSTHAPNILDFNAHYAYFPYRFLALPQSSSSTDYSYIISMLINKEQVIA